MSQLAKLYLRGSLVKQMKDLPSEEVEEIGNLVEMVVKDSALQNTKHEFCNALSRTISNEYADKEVGLGDYKIAIMRAVIAAKYGWGDHEPAESVFTDPHQRKKWFQNWAFNYLKQILRENKILGYKETKNVEIPADMAVIEEFRNVLKKGFDNSKASLRRYFKEVIDNMEVTEEDGHFKIYMNQWILPTDTLEKLQEISNKYLSYNVKVTYDTDGVIIKSSDVARNVQVQQHREVRVKFSSFEAQTGEEDSRKHYLEFEVSELNNIDQEKHMSESDSIRALKEALPDDALKVLKVIIDPPDDYTDKYGNKSFKSHIATYLGMKDRDVDRLMKIIKVNAMALGFGLDR